MQGDSCMGTATRFGAVASQETLHLCGIGTLTLLHDMIKGLVTISPNWNSFPNCCRSRCASVILACSRSCRRLSCRLTVGGRRHTDVRRHPGLSHVRSRPCIGGWGGVSCEPTTGLRWKQREVIRSRWNRWAWLRAPWEP